MKCYSTENFILTDANWKSVCNLQVNNISCSSREKTASVLLYEKDILFIIKT